MSTGDRKVALVTGGAGAIGAAVCERLAARGDCVVVADLDAHHAEAVAGGLTGTGHLGLAMDVADTDAVISAVGRVTEAAGPVDVLINVAGWDRFVPFVDTTREFWDQVIAINYRGPLNTTHAVLPSMIERGRGRIVSVASDAARVGSSLESIYAGAKGAVIAFSKSVAARGGALRHHGERGVPGPHRHAADPLDGRRARVGGALRRRADEGHPDAAPGHA